MSTFGTVFLVSFLIFFYFVAFTGTYPAFDIAFWPSDVSNHSTIFLTFEPSASFLLNIAYL